MRASLSSGSGIPGRNHLGSIDASGVLMVVEVRQSNLCTRIPDLSSHMALHYKKARPVWLDAADLIPFRLGSRLDFTCVTHVCHVLVNRKQSQKLDLTWPTSKGVFKSAARPPQYFVSFAISLQPRSRRQHSNEHSSCLLTFCLAFADFHNSSKSHKSLEIDPSCQNGGFGGQSIHKEGSHGSISQTRGDIAE